MAKDRRTIGRMLTPPAALAFAILAAMALLPSHAQEKEPPAPWKRLAAPYPGAVGTCPPVDGVADAGVCYLVRCDGARGLVFTIRDAALDDFGVRSMRFGLKNARAETIVLDRAVPGEGSVVLAAHPALLKALKRAGGFMELRTHEAANSYATRFPLARAGLLIRQVERTCK